MCMNHITRIMQSNRCEIFLKYQLKIEEKGAIIKK